MFVQGVTFLKVAGSKSEIPTISFACCSIEARRVCGDNETFVYNMRGVPCLQGSLFVFSSFVLCFFFLFLSQIGVV